MYFSHMRIARPVSDLEKSRELYMQGLDMQLIAAFEHHEGFSGIMLGQPNLSWHLEFTFCHTHPVAPVTTDEDLLVLYITDLAEWQARCARMEAAGFSSVRAFNPYWNSDGRTFVDHDGYKTVIQHQAWPPES